MADPVVTVVITGRPIFTVTAGVPNATNSGGSGDVTGPASVVDDSIAAFDTTTGKRIKQGTVTATAVASHLGSTSNPHSTTAAQVGADPTGTAAAAIATHEAASDPHAGYLQNLASFGTSAVLVTVSSDGGLAPAGTRVMQHGIATQAKSRIIIDPVCAQFSLLQLRLNGGGTTGLGAVMFPWQRS